MTSSHVLREKPSVPVVFLLDVARGGIVVARDHHFQRSRVLCVGLELGRLEHTDRLHVPVDVMVVIISFLCQKSKDCYACFLHSPRSVPSQRIEDEIFGETKYRLTSQYEASFAAANGATRAFFMRHLAPIVCLKEKEIACTSM